MIEGESVTRWTNSLKKNSTKLHYLSYLTRFCKYANKLPDELIQQRAVDVQSTDANVRGRMEDLLTSWVKSLGKPVEKPANKGLMHNAHAGICSFFKYNRYPLQFMRGQAPMWNSDESTARAASKTEVRRMIEVSDVRSRALIMFMKDTGISEADIVQLKLKDLGLHDPNEVFSVEPPVLLVYTRAKTDKKAITFLGKEGLGALRVMLKLRVQGTPNYQVRCGKKLGGKRSIGIAPERLTLESPLFRGYQKLLRKQGAVDVVRPLSPNAVSVLIRAAAISAGCWTENFSGHALRRFFQTSLESAGVQGNWVKKMMGYALGGSEASYSKPELETLCAAYKTAYAHLAINEATEQQSRVEFLEKEVERLSMNGHGKASEIEKLNTGLESLKDRLDHLATENMTMRHYLNTLEKEGKIDEVDRQVAAVTHKPQRIDLRNKADRDMIRKRLDELDKQQS